MNKILFASVYSANDTTSFLRGFGPFGLMRDKVQIIRPPLQPLDWFRDWSNFSDIDVVFMHRPYGPQAMGIMNMCKVMGIPLWVDHDDDLLKVTPDNPAFKHFSKYQNLKECIEYSYREADILTVSGEVMAKEIKEKYKVPVIHIQTGIHDSLLKFKKPFEKNNKVSWRGSLSHMTDLLFFQKEIRETMVKYKDSHAWYFYGLNPYFLNWQGDINLRYVDEINLYEFVMAITEMNSSVLMVPLVDTVFNRVKSNLSWLDGTLAGSACIVPDYEEFRRPGAMIYKTPQEFHDLLDMALGDKLGLKECHDESWDYIQKYLITSKLNKQRYEILETL